MHGVSYFRSVSRAGALACVFTQLERRAATALLSRQLAQLITELIMKGCYVFHNVDNQRLH